MNPHAIYHLAEAPYAYGKNEEMLIVRIRVAKDDMSQIIVLYKDRYENKYMPFMQSNMMKKESTDLFDFYETELMVREKRFSYVFKLQDQSGQVMYYGGNGLCKRLV